MHVCAYVYACVYVCVYVCACIRTRPWSCKLSSPPWASLRDGEECECALFLVRVGLTWSVCNVRLECLDLRCALVTARPFAGAFMQLRVRAKVVKSFKGTYMKAEGDQQGYYSGITSEAWSGLARVGY